MKKRKTILTIHDIMRLYNSRGLKKIFFKWLWLKLPIARAGFVTAISQNTKSEILKYVNCSPSKIRVIYNCISPNFVPAPAVFNKEKPVLLQIGTKPGKNVDSIIKAIAGINCKLKIVGKPSNEAMRLLHLYNIDFEWKIELTQAEIIQQYIDSDIVVFVSLYEGFGVPIIEANAMERVVVTSNCSAMAEVAGEAACLVDPLNIESIRTGIQRVIEDDNYRTQLIAAGRENKKKFEANVIAEQYYLLYKEVYSKNNQRKSAAAFI